MTVNSGAWVKRAGLLVLLLLCNLVFFPWRTQVLRGMSSIEDPILDARITYTSAQAIEVARAIGPTGRLLYGLSEVTLDAMYPFVYSTLSSMLLRAVLTLAFGTAPVVRVLGRAPYTIMLLDYGENISLAILLLGYPATTFAAACASVFTTSKWVAAGVNAILLLVASGLAVWYRARSRFRTRRIIR